MPHLVPKPRERPSFPNAAPNGMAFVATAMLQVAFVVSLFGWVFLPAVGIPITVLLFVMLVLLNALHDAVTELRYIRWNLEVRRWLDEQE
jgi:hypothetical protein